MPKYYLGIVVAHENKQLADVLLKAMNVLIANGTYDKVMDKWDLGPMKLEKPGINLTSTTPL
jgi:polar amino acid transport system substrate-binding protein